MINWKAAALAALVAASAPAIAQSGWARVGGSTAEAGAATTSMIPTLEPRYREIMFCVDGHLIRLNDATIHFEGGTQQTVRVRARVADGGCSRMSMIGSRRTIERVEIGYDPATLAGVNARVELYAR
jgi:hypothetical protein